MLPFRIESASSRLKALDTASNGSVSNIINSGEFLGKTGEISLLHQPEGFKAKRVIIVGLGKRSDIDHESFRTAAGHVSRHRALSRAASAAFAFAVS
ncbi:MAG: hypothetical protein IH796_08700, partial [Deltaproteobacteria bacterium]|nr:hypothetical protein [Deltaproteobacteria bacterium]